MSRKALLAIGVMSVSLLLGCSATAEAPPPTDSEAGVSDLDSMTDEELTQLQLDAYWSAVIGRFPEASRPEVAIARFISLNEYAVTIASCLNDAGWTGARATPDNGVESGDVPLEQRESIAMDLYVCQATYPVDPRYNRPLSPTQLSELYNYFENELRPCLERLGYPVPPAPSEATFIETYAENGGWDVYGGVAANVNGQDEWDAVNAACPQSPDFLFG